LDEALANSAWGIFKLIAALPEEIFPSGLRAPEIPDQREGLIDNDD